MVQSEGGKEGKLTPDVVGLGFLFEVKDGGRGGLKQGERKQKSRMAKSSGKIV
jgi:hypothetical protein